MTNFIKAANWRYATKKFDTTKKVSDEDFDILKEAMRLSSSSYGLQPYKILIVENPELREQLQPAAWGQSQIVDASHLVVFANIVDFGETQIDDYIEQVASARSLSLENISGYANFMKSKIIALPTEQKNIWTAKQTYLALGNLLNAAAELRIDVTPMEGFDPKLVNEILGLNEIGLNATLMATIGYRHEEDATQYLTKVRKPTEELFITL
ncbi:MAG: NAD(P)H-dependent oxidoreductase [Flavobacterium sp.]